MQKLVCEMCGSQDLQKQSGLYVCQSCGTKYSPEEAKKLLVEVSVKVDETDHIQNLYKLARQARENGNNENAAKYYDQILPFCPDDWEATFFSVYYRSACCVIRDIAPACNNVTNALSGVFKKIQSLPASEKKAAVRTVANACTNIAQSMFNSALKHHMSIDVSIMSKYNQELKQRLVSASWIAVTCANCIMTAFGKEPDIAQYVQIPAKMAIQYQSRQSYVSIVFETSTTDMLLGYIGQFDPDFVTQHEDNQKKSVLRNGIVCLVLGGAATWFGLGASETLKWCALTFGAILLLYGAYLMILLAVVNKTSGASAGRVEESAPQPTSQQSAPADGWTCTCGKVNASYVSSCSCGVNRRDVP